jgi:DNA-binding transcriptional MerR regulator
MAPELDLLTTAQVARLLGKTVKTINIWAAEGRIPVALKLPGPKGANLYRRADVDALLTEAGAA